jgi:hypothetical protein
MSALDMLSRSLHPLVKSTPTSIQDGFSQQTGSDIKSWQSFEDLCLSLFKALWSNLYAQKNGDRGQPQHGVDVFGSRDNERSRYHVLNIVDIATDLG